MWAWKLEARMSSEVFNLATYFYSHEAAITKFRLPVHIFLLLEGAGQVGFAALRDVCYDKQHIGKASRCSGTYHGLAIKA